MIAQLDMFAAPPEPDAPDAALPPTCDCGADLMADLDWFIWGEFGDWQCRACWAEQRRTYVSRRKERA